MGGGGGGTKPKDHPEERTLAEIGEEQWAEYKSTYIPIENQWMARVQKLDDPNQHALAQGLASSEFKQANRDTLNNTQMASSAGDAFRRGGDFARAASTANNAAQISNRASLGVTDRYIRGAESIVGVGQGQATEGLQGLSDVAEQAVQGRIDNSKNRYEREQGKRTMYGALAGGGLRYGLEKTKDTGAG
jgi:hypothetical protein